MNGYSRRLIFSGNLLNYKDGEEKITFEDVENSELGEFIKEQKNKPERKSSDLLLVGDPNGIRTHDTTVKGWCLNRLTMGPHRYLLVVAARFELATFRV